MQWIKVDRDSTIRSSAGVDTMSMTNVVWIIEPDVSAMFVAPSILLKREEVCIVQQLAGG